MCKAGLWPGKRGRGPGDGGGSGREKVIPLTQDWEAEFLAAMAKSTEEALCGFGVS